MAVKDIAIITLAFVAGIAFLGVTSNAQGVGVLAVGNANYGADCNETATGDETKLCNKSKHLICSSSNTTGTCRCEVTMMYDPTLEKCIVLAGNDCIERVNDGSFPTTCVENSVCVQPIMNMPGKCDCLMDFIQTQTQECKLGFNGTGCKTHTDCNIHGFLQCGPNNTCVCDQELSEWDGNNQCLGLAGAMCTANVTTTTEAKRTCSGSSNTYCKGDEKNGTCSCLADFVEDTSLHKCYKGYEANCTGTSNECHPELECQELKKQCLCRANEYYQDSTGTCVILAGSTCDPGSNKCVENSACLKDTSGNSTCQCVEGYSKDDTSYCRASYNTNCTADLDCNTDAYLSCDTVNGGVCVCNSNYTYQNQRCEGKFGVECKIGENCMTSFCDKAFNETIGTCSCPDGSSASTDKERCYLNHGQTCGTGDVQWECNSEYFLGCSSTNKCDCQDPNLFLYQPTFDSKKCRAKADTQCDTNIQKLCVGNSTCNTDSSQGTGIGTCKCDAGFRKGSEGQCTSGAVRSLQASLAFAFLMTIFSLFSSKN